MNAPSYSTRTPLANSRYPSLTVVWTRDDDWHGYTGRAQVWIDGNTKEGHEHYITVRQGIPLGSLFVTLDPCIGGCWSMTSIEGGELTVRDLMWAAAWAGENYHGNREHWRTHQPRDLSVRAEKDAP